MLKQIFFISMALYAVTLLAFGWEPVLLFAYVLIGGAALFLVPTVFVVLRESGGSEK
ncbi:MAG: hypothetical protein L0332_25430 [Chloroflexi bacterium]|nr:hypothetical protein [Chloroflexota bacterium]